MSALIAGLKTAQFWLKAAPWIAGLLALAGVVLFIDHRGYQRGFHKRDPEVAALQKTIADVRTVQAKAATDNIAHVQQVEAAQAAVTKEQTDALSKQLADARAAVRTYIVRQQANQGSAGGNPLPVPANSSGAVDDPSAQALVPVADLDACAQAYVTATGWQAWWKAQAGIAR
jgi:hypothetical protein